MAVLFIKISLLFVPTGYNDHDNNTHTVKYGLWDNVKLAWWLLMTWCLFGTRVSATTMLTLATQLQTFIRTAPKMTVNDATPSFTNYVIWDAMTQAMPLLLDHWWSDTWINMTSPIWWHTHTLLAEYT